MQVKSNTDYTLFFCNILLFAFLAFTFSVPFWNTSIIDKIASGSQKHIILVMGYLAIFVVLPIYALSWSTMKFIVENGRITVVDWFGLRRREFSLPAKQSLKVKRETTTYRFRHFPIDSRYNEFKTLYIETLEGKRLRIQSRYIKNFSQLNIAVRKACI